MDFALFPLEFDSFAFCPKLEKQTSDKVLGILVGQNLANISPKHVLLKLL